MKTIDLSSKTTLKPASLELMTEFTSGELALAQNVGGSQAYSDKLIRGYGDKVIGQSSQGFWAGAADFADAPFSVDMEGNVVASTLDLSSYVTKDGDEQIMGGSIVIRDDDDTPVIFIGILKT
jgi:hypothetical protein